MRSFRTQQFHQQFESLPASVQDSARRAFRLWKTNPQHPGLSFKLIESQEKIYSVRIGLHYRALATLVDRETMVWFWIGSHADYDKLL